MFGLISGAEQVPAQPKVSSHAAEGLGESRQGGEPGWGHSIGGEGIPQDVGCCYGCAEPSAMRPLTCGVLM